MGNTNSNAGGLIRVLGPWTATAIVVGTVIGSGIFKKPSEVARLVPDFTTIGILWSVAGLLTLLGALSLAEVQVLFPRAGGNYVFLREGFGRWAGFLWGWVEFWMIRCGSIAALATVFVQSLHDILKKTLGSSDVDYLSPSQQRAVTVGIIAALALVNMRGVRWGGGLQFFITLVKLGSLLAIIVLPFLMWNGFEPLQPTSPLEPVAFSWTNLGVALLAILWPYHGWMNLGPIAGEVKEPQRNLPLALIAGTGTIVFLYLGANLAYHLVISKDAMRGLGDTTVLAAFGQTLFGATGTIFASAAVMCSVFGALNGNLLVGPRLLYAMGEDGLAPRVLGATHPRYHTPARAIAVVAGWSALLVMLAPVVASMQTSSKPIFDMLTDFAMFGAIIFETLAVATIFVFRRTLPDADRPYRCWGYPWVPILYLLLPLYVLVCSLASGSAEIWVGLGFIAVGGVLYALFLRNGSKNDTLDDESGDKVKVG